MSPDETIKLGLQAYIKILESKNWSRPQIAKAGTDNEVELFPYTDITKEQIAEMGLVFDVKYEKTWSCYKDEPETRAEFMRLIK